MKMKKVTALLLAFAMVLGMTACGGTQKEDDTKQDDAVNDAVQDEAEETKDPVTLKVVTWRETDEEYYKEIARRFEEKYDWVTVDLSFNADETSYFANLQADLASGAGPDVFDLHGISAYAADGLILAQDDMDYQANYIESAKTATSYDGTCYAFCNDYNLFGFLYNVDIFEEVGVEVPKTPEELITVVNKLKDAGYGGIAYAGATWGRALAKAALTISLGAEGYKNFHEGIDNGSITDVLSVEGVEAALKAAQIYYENDLYYDAFEDTQNEAAYSLYASGKSAIVYTGTYTYGERDQSIQDVNTGFFAVPVEGKSGVSYAEGGQNTAINAASEHLEEAKLWVEFIATKEISEYYCTNAKVFSCIKGAEPEFDEAALVLANVDEAEVLPSYTANNGDFWESNLKSALVDIVINGKDYKTVAEEFNAKLVEADIANNAAK